MVKKIVLNDNEVVWNEDVSAAQDWRSQDLNSALEARFQASFRSGSATPGIVTSGAILSGLTVTGSTTNLSVTVSGGLAIFGFGGGDVSYDNRFRLASLDADTVVSLLASSPTLHRWDIIEVSAEEVTSTETRSVLTSIGPTRRLIDTTVNKVISSNLRVRVRSGVAAALTAARLPALQPNPAWLPIAAVRIAPGVLIASTGTQIIDLRKFLDYCSPARNSPSIRDGFQSSLTLSSSDRYVYASHAWVNVGGYCGPLNTTPFQNTVNRPILDVNTDKPASLALSANQWYYLYAYRPTLNCGYTSLVLTAVPPDSSISNNQGRPSAPFELPVPWPATDASAPSLYLGAVRLYTTAGVFYPLPFRKMGNYTALAYRSSGAFTGATTQGQIHSGGGSFVTPGTPVTRTINPDGDGFNVVPPHTKLVRVSWQLENVAISVDPMQFDIVTDLPHPFYLYRTQNLDPDVRAYVELDVPTDDNFSYTVIATGTVTDQGVFRGWVQGFYEDMP